MSDERKHPEEKEYSSVPVNVEFKEEDLEKVAPKEEPEGEEDDGGGS